MCLLDPCLMLALPNVSVVGMLMKFTIGKGWLLDVIMVLYLQINSQNYDESFHAMTFYKSILKSSLVIKNSCGFNCLHLHFQHTHCFMTKCFQIYMVCLVFKVYKMHHRWHSHLWYAHEHWLSSPFERSQSIHRFFYWIGVANGFFFLFKW